MIQAVRHEHSHLWLPSWPISFDLAGGRQLRLVKAACRTRADHVENVRLGSVSGLGNEPDGLSF
jgi:hypothetical protein